MVISGSKTNVQEQHAGANSTQIIIQGDYHAGISESDALEIYNKQSEKVIKEFYNAIELYQNRLEEFKKYIFDNFGHLLNALGDPSFQSLLQKSQNKAALTGSNSYYDK